MEDASALLWQAIVFLLVALGYALISPDLSLFPYMRLAPTVVLILAFLAMLALRRRLVPTAIASSVVVALAAGFSGALVFYELLFVVSPARIGMLGLASAYVVGGLLGCAAHASLGAGRHLWHLRAINPHFPQAGVAPVPRKSGGRRSRPTRGDAT